MDELKNLMIQTMEANGILGQLRAQIRCSVFKIIDNQDDMENPRLRGKSALHWENPKARECLAETVPHALLLAELIREYLDFYALDYSKQIFMPETNLGTKKQSSKEELIDKAGLGDNVDSKKPLLLQILEQFKRGGGAQSSMRDMREDNISASPEEMPDMQFSNNKSKGLQPLSVGEGILPPERTPPKMDTNEKTDAHIDKANSLLDEISREEKSGFKADLLVGLDMSNPSIQSSSPDKSVQQQNQLIQQQSSDPKRSRSDIEDNYEDEFDNIEEDIERSQDDLEDSQGQNRILNQIGDTHGITVSQSLGIDPSVDSLALEDYDHIEPVDKIQ